MKVPSSMVLRPVLGMIESLSQMVKKDDLILDIMGFLPKWKPPELASRFEGRKEKSK